MTPEDRFELSIGPYGPADLDVVSFQGREGISAPSSFEITLAVTGVGAERFRAAALGAGARLTLRSGAASSEGASRRIQGVIAAVRDTQADPEHGRVWFTVQLVSRLWLLDHGKKNRVFRDRSAPEIVAEVLGAWGVEHAVRLTRAYAPRGLCVQYDETDLELVTRLLRDEGIFYIIEDPPDDDDRACEVVALEDAAAREPAASLAPRLPFRPRSGMAEPADAVERFSIEDRIRPSAVQVSAFDFRRPRADLASRAAAPDGEGAAEARLLLHEHRFSAETEGPLHAADLRLEQARADARMGAGESRCLTLAPGRRFSLEDHPEDALNRAYAVLELRHEGRVPDAPGASFQADSPGDVYRNELLCLPAEVIPRPSKPPRRVRQVLETATVVGPGAPAVHQGRASAIASAAVDGGATFAVPSDDIHTDALGRVKVRFHWDQDGRDDEASSCWLRVVQAWAGAGWGCQLIPRVGMEVAVAFAGGDPDHPVIVGALHDAVHPPPFPLPRSKTQSGIRTRSSPGGAGYNELSFDDAAGRERVHLRAERDLEEVVQRDHRRTVGGDEVVRVGGGRDVMIQGDHARTVRGDEVVTIERDLLVHVIGRQVIRVEGRADLGDEQADGAGSPTETRTNIEDEPPSTERTPLEARTSHALPSPAAGETAGAERAATPPAPAEARKVLWALLLYRIARLPRELGPLGVEIEARVDAAAKDAAGLVEAVDELEREAEAPAAGAPALSDDPAGRRLATRATILEERARRAARDLAGQLAEMGVLHDERMAKVRAAAEDRLRAALGDAEACARRVHEVREASAGGGSASAPGARRGGSGRGGGGGGAIKEHRTQGMSFQTADKDGTPRRIETRGGSILEIEGGGKIVSRDGLKLEVGGCSIEMANGVITITGAQVIIKGTPVRIN